MQRSTTKTIKWFLAVALAVGVGGFIWLRSPGDTPVIYKTARIDRGSVEQVVTASGQLSAVVTVQVGSQVSGMIQRLAADFNDQVREGQIIAQIDATRFRATLQQAQAALKNAQASAARARVSQNHARREYDRAKALSDRKVIGEAELEDLRAKYELAAVELSSSEAQVSQARAALNAARVDLERTTIRAPISGTVLQRTVDVGQTVAASLQAPTLFTIAQDLAKMEVRAQVDEADVGKLRENLEAWFTVDAYPSREFVATIHQIRSNPNVQQNVVTYDAILRVDNPDGKLRPGMTANVRIVSERRDNVLRVPNAALRFKPPAELILAAEGSPGDHGRGVVASGANGGGRMGRRGGAPDDGAGPGRGPGRRTAAEGADGAAGEGRSFARVYRAAGEKVQTLPFRPGIADDAYTEVLSGPISQGDEVVVDATGGVFQHPADAQRSGQSGGSSRNRGRRFF